MSFADIVGLAGLLVGVVGFPIAIYQLILARRQIKRAVTAAEAARDAIARTERLAALLELTVLIPRMQRVERDLNLAVGDANKTAAENHLHDWRTLAAETRGVLTAQPFSTTSLEGRLQESSQSAAQAITQLRDGDVASATKWVVTLIATATEEAAVTIGNLKAHPPMNQEPSDG